MTIEGIQSPRVGPDPVPEEEIRRHLAALLDDRSFEANEKRRQLLRFVVEEELAGRGHLLRGRYLASHVFGRNEEFDQSEDPIVRIEARRLRANLDAYYLGPGCNSALRMSIPKGGYRPRFDAVLPAGSTKVHEAPVTTTPDRDPLQKRRFTVTPVAVAAFVFLALVVGLLSRETDLGGTQPPRPSAIMPPSVLVRPFEALSGQSSDTHLAAGVTHELISGLMQYPDLRLYSAADSFANTSAENQSNTGSGPFFSVEGSVRSTSRDIHLTARLLDSESRVIWSGSFDRELRTKDVLALQAEMARAIAVELGQPFGAIRAELTKRIDDFPDHDFSSYACVLRGYEYRRTYLPETYEGVRDCLEEAVVRDPDYAEAWAMLALLRYHAARFTVDSEDREMGYALAVEAGQAALALDPDNVQALKALSFVAHYTGRDDEAQELAGEALAASPNDPEALMQLGWLLSARGNLEAGIPFVRQAIDRSVNPPPHYFHMLAIDALMRGDSQQMLAMARRAVADNSSVSHSLLAIAHGAVGDRAAAKRDLAAMAERWPLMAQDPAAAYGLHRLDDRIVAAIVEGLHAAGWRKPK